MWKETKKLANEALTIASNGGRGSGEFLHRLEKLGLVNLRVVLLDREDGEYAASLGEIPYFGNVSADLVFDVMRPDDGS